MASILEKVKSGIDSVFDTQDDYEKQCHTQSQEHDDDLRDEVSLANQSINRYSSFAPPSTGDAKWYVDGCSYFWAVSEALEQAQEDIFILDWWLSPELYLRRPPSLNEQYRVDYVLKAAAERGVKVYIIVYKEVEAALTCDSHHTKEALEALHPNISVFRHPDHTPTGYDLAAELGDTLTHLTNLDLAKASGDAIKALYGSADDVVLFWAHHEKLLVVDGKIGFMGGLDMCFGRWDTNSHPIADAHPGNLDAIIFPGQDYNNARVYDFHDVGSWNENKREDFRPWALLALADLSSRSHEELEDGLTRNFIWEEKYQHKDPEKYETLQGPGLLHCESEGGDNEAPKIQLTRSACKWSSGHETEHSIVNAYIDAITNAEHCIYIENQFFITATGDDQHAVTNRIGAAIVDRIIRAHQKGQAFKIWIVIPAVPAFAGDLQSDGALGTRAIMEFQYFSICRGGHSILEKLWQNGIEDPRKYISFYNLRNYDRINTSQAMADAEKRAGVSYEEGRRAHDECVGNVYHDQGEIAEDSYDKYEQYQRAAAEVAGNTKDTISSCYTDNGPSIVDINWGGNPEDEINAFVSEELYVHTKLLIADDRLVICGSANLNDRSQLGTHDSEIAVVIEDPTPVESMMNGEPYRASQFATSLRRQIFRKHLGLLPDQRWDQPDDNWHPIDQAPNVYDWGSPSDLLVQDPLHSNFDRLWSETARVNTEVFSRAFHPVPNDQVRSWEDYKNFFTKHFIIPGVDKEECCKGEEEDEEDKDKVEYGHIIREEFPGGITEVKEWLSRIRGTLVDMPLNFLADVEDIAKEGLTLNSLTDELYT